MAESPDGTRYIFDNGEWRVAKFGEGPIIEHPPERRNMPREFGPEWTRVQIPNTQMIEYRRELKVPAVRRRRQRRKVHGPA
jgi:hypothetical protein